MANKNSIPGPGSPCRPDGRKARKGSAPIQRPPEHIITMPDDDLELKKVLHWLQSRPELEIELRDAILDAINYVLEGPYTGRYYLHDPEVDSDERASVGTKLQYRVLTALGLPKQKPLDTIIEGIPVELKTTVRNSWMIPTESQCEICLLIRIDAESDYFHASLMRAHRKWLRDGANKDGKRGFTAEALHRFLTPVTHGPLPRNPLRDLTEEQLGVVFGPQGQVKRLTAFFHYMPHTVVPRSTIESIGRGAQDPLRRVRQAKKELLNEHDLVLLCATWIEDRIAAASAGFEIAGGDWVAIEPGRIAPEYRESAVEKIQADSN